VQIVISVYTLSCLSVQELEPREQGSYHTTQGKEMKPKYIVIHTAAANIPNVDVTNITRWHLAKGWNGIGYHYVIVNDKHVKIPDGTLQEGRPLTKAGAHCQGLNNQSIGICMVGHGDINDFTPAQYKTLYALVKQLMTKYNIPDSNVIGHREVNLLIREGVVSPKYRTNKSCPGKKINMSTIREHLTTNTQE